MDARHNCSAEFCEALEGAVEPSATPTFLAYLHVLPEADTEHDTVAWLHQRLGDLADGKALVAGEAVDPSRIHERIRLWFDERVEVRAVEGVDPTVGR